MMEMLVVVFGLDVDLRNDDLSVAACPNVDSWFGFQHSEGRPLIDKGSARYGGAIKPMAKHWALEEMPQIRGSYNNTD